MTALTTRAIETMGERIVKRLDAAAASVSRDALAKNLYAKLFDWLVAAINRKISAIGMHFFKMPSAEWQPYTLPAASVILWPPNAVQSGYTLRALRYHIAVCKSNLHRSRFPGAFFQAPSVRELQETCHLPDLISHMHSCR